MGKYLIFIVMFFVCCKKEKQAAIPTIQPLEYLPVYPGSQWTYINEVGDTVTQSTSAEYQLHRYSSERLGGNMTDNVYVPFWNGEPVYGYSSPLETNSPAFISSEGLTQVPYLTQKQGEEWTIYGDQYGRGWRITGNIDTSLTVNSINYNHVIVVRLYGGAYSSGSTLPKRLASVSYYAKNIGLIKEDYYQQDTVYKHIDLVSYNINH